jgi:hypothetical protein
MRFQRSIVLVVLLLVLYCTGYALLGHRVDGFRDPQSSANYCGFSYSYSWEAKLFIPAAAAESIICHRNVLTGTKTELTWRSVVRDNSQ